MGQLTVVWGTIFAITLLQDFTPIIQQAKREVIAKGTNVDSSECARFEVTNRSVQLLNSQGNTEYCLLEKLTGNNCQGYAVDAIIDKRTGQVIDVIGAGVEGANTPHWIFQDITNRDRCKPALGLPTNEPKPSPDSLPQPQADLGPILAKLDQISYQIEQLQQQEKNDTEKIQQQIDQVVKNAEKSAPSAISKLVQLITLGLAAGAVAK